MKINKYVIDEKKLTLIAGNGGNGCVSFHRNKYIIKGGPDGGNGGNGGNIYISSNKNLNTLNHFKYKKIITALNGKNGKKKNCTGKNGKNIILYVPLGTKIKNINNKITYELNSTKKILIAKGGKHGIGNNKFKSSTNRTPLQYTKGKKGEKIKIKLILKYIADIGIIGIPNAGKSSLIKKLSNIKPKIENYPFTTLFLNLGIFFYKKKKTKYVIADIPGIIKGSYKNNNGLGIKFLKHIEKCKLLLHVVEIKNNINNILKNIKILIKEIYLYKKKILNKEIWLIFNKSDLFKEKKIKNNTKKIIKILNWKKKYFYISIIKNKNINILTKNLYKYLTKK